MKNILILFVVLFIFGCDSDDSSPATIGPVNPNQEDTQPPSISIPRGSDIIEVLTDLNFSVSDASDMIETVLTLDGTQVLETTDTAFSFQIDPFDFDDGEKTLVITAEDEAGNQAEAQLVFTTQKLLFSASDFRGQLSTAEKRIFIALNTLTGETITHRELTSATDGIFYAEDGFARQNIIATVFEISTSRPQIFSYTDVPAGTIVPSFAGASAQFNTPPNNFGEFSFTVTDDAMAGGFDGFNLTLQSHTYRNFGGSGDNNMFTLNCGYGLDIPAEDIFIYFKNPFDNAPDDYRYLLLESNDFSDKTANLSEFSQDWDRSSVELPSGIIGYSFFLRGFTDEAAYTSNEYDEYYRVFYSTDVPATPIEFPEIDLFPIVQQRLTLQVDATTEVRASVRGTGTFTLPGWTITRTDDMISTDADYDSFTFLNSIQEDMMLPRLFWYVYGDATEMTTIPYESITVPEAITTVLDGEGYDVSLFTNDSDALFFILNDNEMEAPYLERIFYEYTGNEKGDRIESFFELNP